MIVGKLGWKAKELGLALQTHALAGERLFWLTDVDDGQLAWLYAHGTVLFAASRDEGFGLPVAEARSYGLPVVATDLVVFREFEDGFVAYFKPDDAEEAARLLRAALSGEAVIGRGAKREGNATSWNDTARQILRWAISHDGSVVR